MKKRYIIVVLGSSDNIDDDLNHIADSDFGVNFVDGSGIFIGTFYTKYTINEIYELLTHNPAFLLFDISKTTTNAINLPTKYFMGLFPEMNIPELDYDEETELFEKIKEKDGVEEYFTVNEILDKLSKYDYDRTCLTDKEIKILDGDSK
jgi:hypothetical protein